MDETKIAYLESEIVKLNKIIVVLIEQNDTLKAKVAYLESSVATPNVISPYVKTETGGNKLRDGYRETETGGNNLRDDPPKTETGGDNVRDGYREKDIGGNNLRDGYREKDIGGNNLRDGHREKDIGGNNVLPPIPYFIPLSSENINKLYNSYGAGFFFRVKQDARRAMTLILLHAYNKSGCSYAELQKLTHRSAGGITKLVASLKKRGLVERSGKSTFRLTPLTLEFIRKANCNPQGEDFREAGKKK